MKVMTKGVGLGVVATVLGHEEIVAIAAFVSQLPGLSPESYSELTRGSGRNHAEAMGHE